MCIFRVKKKKNKNLDSWLFLMPVTVEELGVKGIN